MEYVFHALLLTYTSLNNDLISIIQKFLKPIKLKKGTLLFESTKNLNGKYWKIIHQNVKSNEYILQEISSDYRGKRVKCENFEVTKRNLYPKILQNRIQVDSFVLERDYIVVTSEHTISMIVPLYQLNRFRHESNSPL